MVDAIVVGAGPAGSMAALVMARAGARVLIVDRETFPRDVVCGDRLGPAALGLLLHHGLDPRQALPDRVAPLVGCHLRAPFAVSQAIREPAAAPGVGLRRRVFDHWLLDAAIQAGARFEPGWDVRAPLFDEAGTIVRGVVIWRRTATAGVRLPALVVIAADGRDSTLARQLGLRAQARVVYRAACAYVGETPEFDFGGMGEMHLMPEAYLGVTPLGAGGANVWGLCREGAAEPDERVRQFAAGRFGPGSGSTQVSETVTLATGGATAAGVPGLLLAGDATGCRGPFVGDGVYRAMLGGQLAAEEALRVIESGSFLGAASNLDAARRQHFGDSRRERLRQARWRLPWGARAAGVIGALSPRLLQRDARRASWIG